MIIFTDVDGTLVDYRAQLPLSAKKAVEEARANGHRVYLCTGCSKAELAQRNLPETDGLIGGNGAYVEDDGKVILHQKLTVTEVKSIADWCEKRHLGLYLESNGGMYCNDWMIEQGTEVMTKYAMGKGADQSHAETIANGFVNGFIHVHGEEIYRDDINKMDFILSSYQDYLDAVKDFPNLEVNTWGGKDEQALFGDLSPKGISKKNAIAALLEHLHETPADTIAFGDAKIDISMFNLCGYSVAMGNAGAECKTAADYVTDDVDNDGFYNAFKYLKLI